LRGYGVFFAYESTVEVQLGYRYQEMKVLSTLDTSSVTNITQGLTRSSLLVEEKPIVIRSLFAKERDP